MKVNYKYSSPSMCIQQDGHMTLGLSPDISRDEKVSFHGRLKDPLVFRDAMLMLREIVISDSRLQKKERTEFFEWLNSEIDKRVIEHDKYMPGLRKSIQENIDRVSNKLEENASKIDKLKHMQSKVQKEINSYDAWSEYYKIEKEFWKFIKSRDSNLWFVLDPVITVHPDKVSFEAFSVDESTYGCLSIDMDEFEMLQQPKLGTTNIDFSAKLATEMQRFRTYTDVNLCVNPDGFTVDSGITPEHIEKKIDLPETWVKGFNQVSAAASLNGITIDLTPVDMYDICSFLRRHKENKSPRYMKWIFESNKPIKIVFEPFGLQLTLNTIYTGNKNREEKIWGRRRWLVMEKLIPIAKSFNVKLFGFGMPQFIIADLGKMKMTIGFSSWSSNDWVKGTAFNIMSGFIGKGNYDKVYNLLKEKRFMSIDDICSNLHETKRADIISGIGYLLKRGEGYFDAVDNVVRFRKLYNEKIPKHLYETTQTELDVQKYVNEDINNFSVIRTRNNEFIFKNLYKMPNPNYKVYQYRNTQYYNEKFILKETSLTIDDDGQICKVDCKCSQFNRGPRNISAPCAHILALYIISVKFTKLELEYDKEYKTNDIMEMLL